MQNMTENWILLAIAFVGTTFNAYLAVRLTKRLYTPDEVRKLRSSVAGLEYDYKVKREEMEASYAAAVQELEAERRALRGERSDTP